MGRTVAIGIQDFETLREHDLFYIDKTSFIREWWNNRDAMTLITRPRRFGKTLNMSMLDYFFSNRHAGRADLFEGLDIWKEERFRKLQGTYPVIFLTFAGVKFRDYENTKAMLNGLIKDAYKQHRQILEDSKLSEENRIAFRKIKDDMSDKMASEALRQLCELLYKYYGKKCIILLDEYDTPMQEAFVYGYWDEVTGYIRALFNNTFKTNPYLERAIMTGITRISKDTEGVACQSIFSDLNNLKVVTTTSNEYATAFGFTEEEVFAAMDEQEFPETEKERVKFWYDGFTFGKVTDIYNPWSVILYLDEKRFDTFWANTSGNGLVNKLIREDDKNIKTDFEVKRMFEKMVRDWFARTYAFGGFVSAMFRGDELEMNEYMNDVALYTFSSFDTGNHPSEKSAPERFYHGFVLGLLVEQASGCLLKSNKESGYGRYDVVMEPKNIADPAVIMEFKVRSEVRGEMPDQKGIKHFT